NHLDLAYQKELLDVLKTWTRKNHLTVVAIFHDLNLAGLYWDRLLLLNDGKLTVCCTQDDVLKKSPIDEFYNSTIEKHPHPEVPKPQITIVPHAETADREGLGSENFLGVTPERIVREPPQPLRTGSSAGSGSGVGWHRVFVTRHVSQIYDC